MSKSDRRLSLSSSANSFFLFFGLHIFKLSYTVQLSSAKLLAVSYGFFFSVIVDQQFFFLGIILILGKFNFVEIDETLEKYETYFAYASHGSLGCRLHMKNILDFEKYSHLLFNSSSI